MQNSCTEKKENIHMKLRLLKLAVKLQQIAKDTRGQDLIEYALMAGFVSVAAGAIMPGVARSITVVFSQVDTTMIAAAARSEPTSRGTAEASLLTATGRTFL